LRPAHRSAGARPGARRRPRRGGFSLVELMVVGAVIGLGTYVISVSYDAFVPKERLNTAVRSLTALLRETRSQAISRSLEFFVEYDLDGERYRRVTPFVLGGGRFMEGEDDDADRAYGNWQSLPDGVELATVAVAGEVFESGPVFARFDPRGAASDHQVVLKQPAYGNFFTVEVMALTGTFKFHRDVYIREAPDDGDFR